MFRQPKCSRIMAVLCVTVIQLALAFSARTDDDKKCASPPSGLVSWWPGDGNANDIAGPNTGVLSGGATFAPGFVGEAFSFNGSTAYMQATTANILVGTADRTLEMWVTLDATIPANEPTIRVLRIFFCRVRQLWYVYRSVPALRRVSTSLWERPSLESVVRPISWPAAIYPWT